MSLNLAYLTDKEISEFARSPKTLRFFRDLFVQLQALDATGTSNAADLALVEGDAAKGIAAGQMALAVAYALRGAISDLEHAPRTRLVKPPDQWQSFRIRSKADIGLQKVENTSLSTWAGTTNITTLGTITTGVWNGTVIGAAYGGTGLSALGAGVATFLGTPSSANLRAALTDETGTGAAVFADTPTLVTPIIGAATGTSVVLTGNASAAALVPTGASTPTNGVFLPAANTVGVAAGSNTIARFDGSGLALFTTTFASGSVMAVQTASGKLDVRSFGGSSVQISSSAALGYNSASGTGHIFNVNDVQVAAFSSAGLLTTASTTLHATSAALTNGAGASVGTLTNAPAAGNPTKWVPIDDNGTTRYIPAW